MTAGLIDLGLEGKGAFHLIVCLVLRTYDIQRLWAQFLLHLSVHQEACHLVGSLYGKGMLLACRNTIVERVEVSLSLKSQLTFLGIGQIHHGMSRAQEFCSLLLLFPLDGEGYGIVISYLFYRQLFTGLEHILLQSNSARGAMPAQFVDTGSLTQIPALCIKFCIRTSGVLARPALDGNSLNGRERAVMDILDCDAIACYVIPYGKHATLYGGVFLLKCMIAYDGRCPVLVEILTVEIIVIISSGRDYVGKSVGDADELVSLLLHLHGVGISVVPDIHEHILMLDRCIPIGMGQGSPQNGLFAKTFHITYVVVREGAELLHHLLLGVGIFICADVYTRSAEHRLFPVQILSPEIVHEGIHLGVEQVQMVHPIFLASQRGIILRKGQGMGRSVKLRDDLHTILLCQNLQVDKLLLGIMAILGRETGIGVTFHAEARLGTTPVIAEILAETIVVEMYLQGIHLIVRHDACQMAQIGDGNKLTSAVYHESTQAIVGLVGNLSFGKSLV